ncbi:NTP transferase domain-containing protein [Candidatus Woesearchaeota archaeon]|nr:NTP transferase domain-containing protein [Candidatus Woesearchaeota archaeon]
MKAIIPVAGFGTRLRPHTYTTPKALVTVAGKPILGHILDQVHELGIKDVVLILGYLGTKIKEYVEEEYSHMNFAYAYQEKALGPGHAISLAKPFVESKDKLLIIYGDTIFVGNMKQGLKTKKDGALAVKRVEDPRRFGIVEMKKDKVVKVVEKPDYIKPRDAMIGIYFISKAKLLFDALDFMIEDKRMTKGEFYLTDALQVMIEKGAYLTTFQMEGWFDCGKPETLLATNRFLLEKQKNEVPVIKGENTIIIPPVYIGKDVTLNNSIIGPHVSISDGAIINTSILKDSIINKNADIENAQLQQSLIGENAVVKDMIETLNIGDNSVISFSKE